MDSERQVRHTFSADPDFPSVNPHGLYGVDLIPQEVSSYDAVGPAPPVHVTLNSSAECSLRLMLSCSCHWLKLT